MRNGRESTENKGRWSGWGCKKQSKDLWLCWDHSLPAWVRRLCAAAWLGLQHIHVLAVQQKIRPAPFISSDPKCRIPCRPQVHVECPKALFSVLPPARCLGKAFRTFCLQRQPLGVLSVLQKQEKHLKPLSDAYNRLVFLPCLVYLHVRNVHLDKEIINKDRISCAFLNPEVAFPTSYS